MAAHSHILHMKCRGSARLKRMHPTRLSDLTAMHEADTRARTFTKWIVCTARARLDNVDRRELFAEEMSGGGSQPMTKAAVTAMTSDNTSDLLAQSRAFVEAAAGSRLRSISRHALGAAQHSDPDTRYGP